MSSHESHDHPNTPAARAKCRRATSTERIIRATPIDTSGVTRELVRDLYTANRTKIERAAQLNAAVAAIDTAQLNAVINAATSQVEEFDPTISHPTYIPATATHCELCGSFDIEDLETGDQGYTACCNEPTCDGRSMTMWTWVDHSEPITSTKRTGTIQTCCSARISFPHDNIQLMGRAF